VPPAEVHSFKTDVAKQFGAVRAQNGEFKSEVTREIGLLRTAGRCIFPDGQAPDRGSREAMFAYSCEVR
jgi:hypothetical protein